MPEPADAAARRRIEDDLDATLMVEAGAGAGKTESLARRVVGLLRTSRAEPGAIAAITFTRRAAAELRQRVQERLEDAAAAPLPSAESERVRRSADRLGDAFVGTIHSFCARLLREHPFEAGLDPDFRELEGAEAEVVLNECWERWLGRLRTDSPGVLADLDAAGLGHEELRSVFTVLSAQRDVAAVYGAAPAPDAAAADAKLAEFLRGLRSAFPADPPENGWDDLQLAVRRCERLRRLAAASGGERYLWRAYEALDRPLKVTQYKWATKAGGKDAAQRFEVFRTAVVGPTLQQWREHLHGRVLPLLLPAVAFATSERWRTGRLDYTDLLLGCARLLRENPAVRRQTAGRYRYLLVDEFQDTDPVQAEVMLLLTGDDLEEADWHRLRPRPGSLFVVGDPKQSIYRFRRADIATYQAVKARVGEGGGGVLALTASFRSVPAVTGWVSTTFADLLPAEETPYQARMAPLDPVLPDPPVPVAGVRTLTVPAALTKADEVVAEDARRIAAVIAQACGGGTAVPGDFLVLTYRRQHARVYARHLQRLGIAAETVGLDPETDTPALRAWMGVLQALADPEDPVRLVGCLRGPCFGCSDDDLYAYRRAGGSWSYLRPELGAGSVGQAMERMREYWEWTRRLPAVAAAAAILDDLRLLALAAGSPGRMEEARAIVAAMDRLATSEDALSLPAVVRLLEAAADDRELGGAGGVGGRAVRVINLHQAKGLEARVVFLAAPVPLRDHPTVLHVDRRGPEPRAHVRMAEHDRWGNLRRVLAQPPGWAAAEAAESEYNDAEAVRLLYVACTRAKHLLVVSRWGAGPEKGAWARLEPGLIGVEELEVPDEAEGVAGAAAAGAVLAEALGVQVEAEVRHSRELIDAAGRPAYLAVAATSLVAGRLPASGTPGRGPAWGSAAHRLLRAAIEGLPEADWRAVAVAVLVDEDLDAGLADELVALAREVWGSAFGARVRGARCVLCEVPFALPTPAADLGLGGGPGSAVLQGVIDLAFREEAGWVIADFKTDAAADGEADALVAHYAPQVAAYVDAWRRLQPEPVADAVLVFTSPLTVRRVGRGRWG